MRMNGTLIPARATQLPHTDSSSEYRLWQSPLSAQSAHTKIKSIEFHDHRERTVFNWKSAEGYLAKQNIEDPSPRLPDNLSWGAFLWWMNHHYTGSPACVFSPTGLHRTLLAATSFRRGALKIVLIDNRPGNGAKSPEETLVITVPPKKQPTVFCVPQGVEKRRECVPQVLSLGISFFLLITTHLLTEHTQ